MILKLVLPLKREFQQDKEILALSQTSLERIEILSLSNLSSQGRKIQDSLLKKKKFKF